MNQENVHIREVTVADMEPVTELMNQLGYPTTKDEMTGRLTHILAHPDHKTLVAVLDNAIVGMAGASKNFFYEQNGVYVRVLVLIANKLYRQKGIGKSLMNAVEDWAKEIGATTILLNCGNREERLQAHQFYQKIGYSVKSSGYVKKL